jgi:hypothetical protein
MSVRYITPHVHYPQLNSSRALVSFYFVFISLISFRFVSFLLISFRFVSFSLISFRFVSFRFALYRYPRISAFPRTTAISAWIFSKPPAWKYCRIFSGLRIFKTSGEFLWKQPRKRSTRCGRWFAKNPGGYGRSPWEGRNPRVPIKCETKRNETKRNQRRKIHALLWQNNLWTVSNVK